MLRIDASHDDRRIDDNIELAFGKLKPWILCEENLTHLGVDSGRECGDVVTQDFTFRVLAGKSDFRTDAFAQTCDGDGYRLLQQFLTRLLEVHENGGVLIDIHFGDAPLHSVGDVELQGLHGTCCHSRGTDNLQLILETVGVTDDAKLVESHVLASALGTAFIFDKDFRRRLIDGSLIAKVDVGQPYAEERGEDEPIPMQDKNRPHLAEVDARGLYFLCIRSFNVFCHKKK